MRPLSEYCSKFECPHFVNISNSRVEKVMWCDITNNQGLYTFAQYHESGTDRLLKTCPYYDRIKILEELESL